MLEPAFDPVNSPTAVEVQQETEYRLANNSISYHTITDVDYSSKWVIYLVNSPQRQQVAKSIARYFHRETRFDFPPYSPGDESSERPVYLIRTLRSQTMVPLIAGAVGFRRANGIWVLTWVWIHPWVRNGALAGQVFDTLETLHGVFAVEGPLSKAMQALIAKRGGENLEV